MGSASAGHSGSLRDRRRNFEANFDSAAGSRLDGERAADEHRTFAHAAQAAVLFRYADEAAAVIGDAKGRRGAGRLEGES